MMLAAGGIRSINFQIRVLSRESTGALAFGSSFFLAGDSDNAGQEARGHVDSYWRQALRFSFMVRHDGARVTELMPGTPKG